MPQPAWPKALRWTPFLLFERFSFQFVFEHYITILNSPFKYEDGIAVLNYD
jgi:hypothetical protein